MTIRMPVKVATLANPLKVHTKNFLIDLKRAIRSKIKKSSFRTPESKKEREGAREREREKELEVPS